MDALLATLTSATVAAIVSLIFQGYFARRLEHRFAVKLAEVNAKLAVQSQISGAIAGRKLTAYPKFVELCYRLRNMARDLASANPSAALVEEFLSRTSELEDNLYAARVDLEADSLFETVHDFKNDSNAFIRAIQLQDDLNMRALATKLYASIDGGYQEIVRRCSDGIGKPSNLPGA